MNVRENSDIKFLIDVYAMKSINNYLWGWKI